jgi:serine protease
MAVNYRIPGLVACLFLALTPAKLPAPTGPEIHVPGDYPTIHEALDAARDGDKILVDPGVYGEYVRFSGKNVVLASSGGADVTTIQVNGGTAVDIGPRGAMVGFTITGGSAAFGGGMTVNGNGTVIARNIFDGNMQTAGGAGAAIVGNNASPIIEENLFRNNSSDNQFLSGVISFINGSSPRIVNNIFVDNPSRAINMTLPEGTRPEVINNTMVGNRSGIRVDRRVPTGLQVFRNNLIYGNAIGLEVDFGTESNNPTWEDNLVFGNVTDYQGISDQTGRSGNISADPLFVDAEGGDFHLQPGSPAIDAGSATGAPTIDFEGNPRPRPGGGFSIGAYEFVP